LVTPNAADETNFFSPDANVDEEGIFDRGTFTRDVLINILSLAIQNLKKAELFEAAAEIYKLLVPMFEGSRDYNKLVEAHGDLKSIYSDIIKVILFALFFFTLVDFLVFKANTEESRLFGTYYRVAFFGSEFGHLHEQEFIYREKGLAKLRDISDRLTRIFGPKVGGADKIQIIQQSGEVGARLLFGAKVFVALKHLFCKVDVAALSPGCHIQITRVFPFFEEDDAQRITYYERNTCIRQFMYEAPYLKDPPKPGKTIAEHVKGSNIVDLCFITSFFLKYSPH